MKVTDEMVDAARTIMDKTYADQDIKVRYVIEAAIQAAWVSVGEHLPEHGVIVLNQNSDKVRCRGGVWTKLIKYTVEDFLGEYSYPMERWWYCEEGEVTYWMPLPEFKGE